MFMYTKGSLAGAAAHHEKRRGTPSRVGILTVGRHARHSCYRYTHRWRGLETTKRIQNGGMVSEIDRSVVSAAIRVSSVQNIVKRNMK